MSHIILVRKKVIVYSGANFGFSSHSKSLYAFLVMMYGEANVVFISKKRARFGYNIYSLKGLFYLLFSKKYAITVNIPGFVSIKRKHIIQVWHGIPIKGLGRHDNTLNSLLLHKIVKEFNSYCCIISPSEAYSEIIVDAFMIKDRSKLKIAPLPNMIYLLDLAQQRKNLSENRKARGLHILYAPTFRNHNNRNWDLANSGEFLCYLKSQSINLTTSYHPLDTHYVAPLIDSAEMLIDCDILITDYSSIVFDAILLDKKVILFTPDYEDYIKDRGIKGLNIFNYIAPVKSVSALIELLDIKETTPDEAIKKTLYETLDSVNLSNTIQAYFND